MEQLIDTLEREYGGRPVLGVGHSLGGYLNFLAAVRRPELFRAIILLDAPIIGALRGRMLGATKRLGIVDRVTPAGASRDRRSHWNTREEAKHHFRGRRLFRHFTDASLDDYVRHGLVRSGGALRLRIDPQVEYQIYRTIPHGMSRHLRALRVPARRRFALRKVPGGHLFPFEEPAAAAAAVIELAEALTR